MRYLSSMRLTTLGLFALLACGTACHKSASAAQNPTYYVLETIDAKPLPASWPAGDASITTHWGKLWLYPDGRATTVEYQTHSRNGAPTGGGRATAYSRYRVHGDSIELAFHPCKAPCFLGYVGRISDSTLTLTAAIDPPRYWPLYLYRRSTVFEPPPPQSTYSGRRR